MQVSDQDPTDVGSITRGMSQLALAKNEGLLTSLLGVCLNEPVRDHKEVKQALYLGRLVCLIGIKTIETLLAKELSAFDALVSECQCQLRAVMVAQIATRMLSDCEFLASILKAKNALTALSDRLTEKLEEVEVASRQRGRQQFQTTNVQAVLQGALNEAYPMLVPQEVIPLSQSWMLNMTRQFKTVQNECLDCKEKVDGLGEATDAGKLGVLEKNITKTGLYKKIVELAKYNLSATCCRYIQKEARSHSSPLVQLMLGDENKRYTPVISGTFSLRRAMLPCVYTLMASVQAAVGCNIPIVIKNKRAQHTLELLSDKFDVALLYEKGAFVEVAKLPPDPRPCIVIEGQRTGGITRDESTEDYIRRLTARAFIEIVEMNGAHHSQYAGKIEVAGIVQQMMLESVPLLQSYPDELRRLKQLQVQAEAEGCCDVSQTLFKITHIFSDTVANQQKEMKQ